MTQPAWLENAAAGPLQRLIADQRVLFLIVGGANTAFSTALYAGGVYALGPDVPAVVSLFIAWIVSLVLVFFVYRKLVFRVSGHVLRDFFRFAAVNFASFCINAGLLFLLVDVLKFWPVLTQVAITVLVVIFNYIGHKKFSFRR